MMKHEFNRRRFLKSANLLGLSASLPAAVGAAEIITSHTQEKSSSHPAAATQSGKSAETLLLKDYRPTSIYKIPITHIDKAKHPIIDMHSHPYAKTPQQIDEWRKNMDEVGVQKTMILTMTTGPDSTKSTANIRNIPIASESGAASPSPATTNQDSTRAAVKELERCHQSRRTRRRRNSRQRRRIKIRQIHGARHASRRRPHGRHLATMRRTRHARHPARRRPIWMYQKMDATTTA